MFALIVARKLPILRNHINAVSSFKIGVVWYVFVAATVGMLGYMLFQDTQTLLAKNYEDYPDWFLNRFGWGMVAGLIVVSLLLSLLPWRMESKFNPDAVHKGDHS